MTATSRAEELTGRLAAVHRRIDAALLEAGRTDRPRLIVVTKYFPVADLRILAELGVADLGENRDQEASAKAQELADLGLRWHFIGQLQSNKARSVARYAHAVHSVDRASLVKALGKGVAAERETNPEGRALDCFIQVDLSGADGATEGVSGHQRGGAAPEKVNTLGHLIEGTDGLSLAGVMAVAPLGREPRAAFEQLATISALLRTEFPAATGISAGMSGDLEAAVAVGATHLRIGSQVLGERPPLG
ncbi:YggS family pyridoxal phosphate-dependent enzyme [Arthrobacter sp. CAN_C5]|uniref:YggS family pyridoxal phosphate-dependent enzyme n=1 Tax=Arthrobacter sp. CAN_C5 TaxID=2760706 RepID=UPI001AE93F05|nr:YggS family pyridoxal phosphate-dependent enzyme [Arthrobacter sp. CAN_C5]MBP2217391.1 pyridoxal phosphate enzyme (YggS family) [Arthrobacter sp. CAN_C5]